MIWTDVRVAELELLSELLREVKMIDKATNVLARLERCVSLAEELSRTNRRDWHQSFIDWLRYQAVEDRERNKA